MNTFVQANTNGHLHAADQPSISPLNRGFLYGDAIYEVWRTYDGVLFAWDEHWGRLDRSAAALYMQIPWSRAEILAEIKKTVAAFRRQNTAAREVYVRLQISRGAGMIGLDTGLAERPEFVLLVQENKLFTPEKFKAGLRLSLARELRRNSTEALNPAWKTGNYLNNILCLREARARGADEVVITNRAGEITEAAVSNVAFVRSGLVTTPSLHSGILAGITRDLLIRVVAPAAGVAVREESIRPEELGGIDECFLLSSTKDITPVAAIDDFSYSLGEDTITIKLKRAFANYVAGYVASHPELKV